MCEVFAVVWCPSVRQSVRLSVVSEMTYTVSSGTLNSSIPYRLSVTFVHCIQTAEDILKLL